jgi:recombinational DNA repair ATPase RecF
MTDTPETRERTLQDIAATLERAAYHLREEGFLRVAHECEEALPPVRAAADIIDELSAALRELMSNSGPLSGAHRAEWVEAVNRAGVALAAARGETP